jgi:hypothetical protein
MIPISLHDFVQSPLYTEGKFWFATGSFLFAASQASNRVMNWFKEIRRGVLPKIQGSIDQLSVDLKEQTTQMRNDAHDHTRTVVEGFKEQTATVVAELREQRADFRALYMQPLVAASTKTRRKPSKIVANSKPKRKPRAKQ